MNGRLVASALALLISGLPACGEPDEAPSVELPVIADASGITTVSTDLGYEVEITEARLMIENITFAIAGEAQTASLLRAASELLVRTAHAHPGHYQGGDVTGELRGRFLVDWFAAGDRKLGSATLLAGAYNSANFTFAHASADDGVALEDPILGHTAFLRGRATKDAEAIDFGVLIDSPVGRELAGVTFEFEAKATSREELGVRLLTQDVIEADTLFDGIDFAMLDEDHDGQLSIDSSSSNAAVIDAYNVLRRTFQTHDHFDVTASPPAE